jgi:hypothetical protein
MLNDTQTIGTVAVAFVRRAPTGSISNFVPSGDAPNAERRLRVGNEVAKSGTVNTLYAVSHLKVDPAVPTAPPKAAAVQVKIIRPAFVSSTDMKLIIDQVVKGLTNAGVQDSLLNQEQ